MDGQIQPTHVRGCHIMGRPHPRVLRRAIGKCPKGAEVQAFFQRSPLGKWRVVIMAPNDEHALRVVDESPWKPTRRHAERWLIYRARAA